MRGGQMVLPGVLALSLAPTWMFPEGHLCLALAPHAYLPPVGPVGDADNFLLGVSGGGRSGPLQPLAQQGTLQGPLQPVEVGQPFVF